MFSLLLFVLLTFFLLTKLNEILGIKIGFQIHKENLKDFTVADVEEKEVAETNQKILAIKAVYSEFDSHDFLAKAQKAFEIIFFAYAGGDIKTLKGLLCPRIFQAFSLAIDDRKSRDEMLEGILVRIINTEILDSSVYNDDILVTVKFITEQSNVLKSGDGKIIEGNADFIETRQDVWVFSRKKSSRDLRWYLQEIKSENQ
ncbi:MAG: Tim44/TimA family putative adaptor protein [Holosporaceae bacterium]|jgi:predicted lipid-binding transport protein (Tim44 family)|nr:Tim44/TimA family putative adaptor protein [Holosporaceae bacterium]